MKKLTYSTLGILLAGTGCYFLVGITLGPEISPLAKIFLAFFAAILVLQIIPAAVLFGCLVRGVFSVPQENAEPAIVTEEQNDSSLL